MTAPTESKNWRKRLYDSYVSTGQASSNGDESESRFMSRAPFWRPIIARHIPKRHGLSIADLGCGSGALLHFLAEAGYRDGENGYRVMGVDTSPEQVVLARQYGFNATLGDVVSFLNATDDSSLDVVVACDILEHFERALLFQVLDEIERVLVPGGRLIAHVPNAEGVFGARVRFGDLTHELAFTQKSARQCLRASGFSSIRCMEDLVGGSSFGIRIIRKGIWRIGSSLFRILHAAETGNANVLLTQNITIVAHKKDS